MQQKYLYRCRCGWEDVKEYGGFQTKGNVYDAVQQHISCKMHPYAKNVWEQLLNHALLIEEKQRKVSDVPSFLQNRRPRISSGDTLPSVAITQTEQPKVRLKSVSCVCHYCETLEKELVIVATETDEPLHEIVCSTCGVGVEPLQTIDAIPCPSCQQQIIAEPITVVKRNEEEEVNHVVLRVGSNDAEGFDALVQQHLPQVILKAIQPGEDWTTYLRTAHTVHLVVTLGSNQETKIVSNIAHEAKRYGIKVITVALKPITLDGSHAIEQAELALGKLIKYSDTIITDSMDNFMRQLTTEQSADLIPNVQRRKSERLFTLLCKGLNIY